MSLRSLPYQAWSRCAAGARRYIHYIISNEPCHYYTCVFAKTLLQFKSNDPFSARFIQPFITGTLQIHPKISDVSFYIQEIFEKISFEYDNQALTSPLNIRIYLLQLFEFFIQHNLLEKLKKSSPSSNFVKQVTQFIETHYKEKISISDLASTVNYNPQYFARHLKKQLGYTPTEFINLYRIERACELLFTTNASILEISYEVGFENCSYFIKKFKEIKGFSPKKYQQILLKNYTIMTELHKK